MIPSPALSGALAALNGFAARLPASTGADCVRVVADFATALKAEIAAGIEADAPRIPLVRGVVVRAMIAIANSTIDTAVGQLSLKTGA
jgi:hypothetical protein